ncbi:hypothetical protein GCM10009823_24380 [Brevibacterium salitolerans]|uniref:Uncharacterized protein n=1 Tax=Brevibacterium salitolerans TaxID=1403566 RepID=A0ABN2X1J0_9MICO
MDSTIGEGTDTGAPGLGPGVPCALMHERSGPAPRLRRNRVPGQADLRLGSAGTAVLHSRSQAELSPAAYMRFETQLAPS